MPKTSKTKPLADSVGNSPAGQEISFENALARLEEIVFALEDSEVGLDASLQHYEEGVGILRKAYVMLEKAQRRIEILSGVDSDGNPLTRPLADVATFDTAVGETSNRNTSMGKSSTADSLNMDVETDY